MSVAGVTSVVLVVVAVLTLGYLLAALIDPERFS